VGATIEGTITDPKGAVLPEVKVEILNLSTQIVTTLTSNADGFYTVPNLLPGNYSVTATRSGFATAVTELILTVGAQRVVNVAMHIGRINELVRVQTEVPEVELASSEISGVVNGTTIRELPLNGRDWTQLATLEPGITSIRTQPAVGAGDRGQRGFGTQMTVNGGRPAQTITGSTWVASSSFHALETQIKKNMRHGLQAQASFTWSRSIDTSSAGSIGDNFHNSVSSLPFFSTKLNRGPSDFNVGKNLVTNLEWEIPGPKSHFAAAQWALNGWQLGGIFEASSGVPFSVIISGDPLLLGNTDPFGRPNRLNGPGCGNPVNAGSPLNYVKLECFGLPLEVPALAGVCQPFTDPSVPPGTCANLLGNSGRNQLTGPGLINFDASLFKNMRFKKISETFNAQFRVEVFNVFNHPNFSPPVDNNALFDSTGARLAGAGAIARRRLHPRGRSVQARGRRRDAP